MKTMYLPCLALGLLAWMGTADATELRGSADALATGEEGGRQLAAFSYEKIFDFEYEKEWLEFRMKTNKWCIKYCGAICKKVRYNKEAMSNADGVPYNEEHKLLCVDECFDDCEDYYEDLWDLELTDVEKAAYYKALIHY